MPESTLVTGVSGRMPTIVCTMVYLTDWLKVVSMPPLRHRNVLRKNQGVIDAHEKALRDVR